MKYRVTAAPHEPPSTVIPSNMINADFNLSNYKNCHLCHSVQHSTLQADKTRQYEILSWGGAFKAPLRGSCHPILLRGHISRAFWSSWCLIPSVILRHQPYLQELKLFQIRRLQMQGGCGYLQCWRGLVELLLFAILKL